MNPCGSSSPNNINENHSDFLNDMSISSNGRNGCCSIRGLKDAQQLLKANGFVLMSYGLQKVSFFRADADRDKDGLLKDKDVFEMSMGKFKLFARDLDKR